MSKWQEKGVCPKCNKRKELFIIVPLCWVDIKTGRGKRPLDLNPEVTVECQSCKTMFTWYPSSGRITQKKKDPERARRK